MSAITIYRANTVEGKFDQLTETFKVEGMGHTKSRLVICIDKKMYILELDPHDEAVDIFNPKKLTEM